MSLQGLTAIVAGAYALTQWKESVNHVPYRDDYASRSVYVAGNTMVVAGKVLDRSLEAAGTVALRGTAVVAFTAVATVVGAYIGSQKGQKMGEDAAERNMGSRALQIPIGFVVGGAIGAAAVGATAFTIATLVAIIK